MKFLCLHGNGTNSNIMQLQTAPLRHELEDGHEFEFVEATFLAPMSEGVETLSSPDNAFYAFYNPRDLSTLRQSLDLLDAYIATEGEFDVLMGFSGGAVLAAAYLAEKQAQGAKPPVKCAVFLSSAESAAEFRSIGLDPGQPDLIQIPTGHIWGSKDRIAPAGGRDVGRMCHATLRLNLEHDEGHGVPRKGRYLTESVQLVRRLIGLVGDD